jgi:hypothetical protein
MHPHFSLFPTAQFVFQNRPTQGGGSSENLLQNPHQAVRAELSELMDAIQVPTTAREEITDLKQTLADYLQDNAPDLTQTDEANRKIIEKAIAETLAKYAIGAGEPSTGQVADDYEIALDHIEEKAIDHIKEWELRTEVSEGYKTADEIFLKRALNPLSKMSAYAAIKNLTIADKPTQTPFVQQLLDERQQLALKIIREEGLRMEKEQYWVEPRMLLSQKGNALELANRINAHATIIAAGEKINDVDNNGSVDTLLPSQLVKNITSPESFLSDADKDFTIAKGAMLPESWCTQGTKIGPVEFATPEDEKTVGMAELLPVFVRQVTIVRPNGKTITGATREGLAGGFYANGKYVPIFDGDIINITKTDKNASQQLTQEHQNLYATNGTNPKGEPTQEPLTKNSFTSRFNLPNAQKIAIANEQIPEAEAIYEMAMRHGIDPSLFMALQTQKDPAQRQDFTNLYLTARSIKKLMLSQKQQGMPTSIKDALGNTMPHPSFVALLAAHGVKDLGTINAKGLITAYQTISTLKYTAKQTQQFKKSKRQLKTTATSLDSTNYTLESDPKEGFTRFPKKSGGTAEKFFNQFEFNYEAMPPLKAELIRSIVALVGEGRLKLKYVPRDLARLPLINTKTLQVLNYIGENAHRYPGVRISSMLRSEKFNKSLGASSATSWHRCGSGMDVGGLNYDLYVKLQKELKNEFKPQYPTFDSLVHARKDDHNRPRKNDPNLHLHLEFEEAQSYGTFKDDRNIDKTLSKFISKKGEKTSEKPDK